MFKLISPYLGPIVGYTTSKSAKIWIKALTECEKKSNLSCDLRTIGIIAITQINNNIITNPEIYFFRLHRAEDRAGSFELGVSNCLKGKKFSPLQENTLYTVCTGILIVQDVAPNDYNFSDEELITSLPSYQKEDLLQALLKLDSNKSQATFRTFAENSDELSFVFGSCRYPGILWQKKNADRIFKSIAQNLKDNQSTQFFMMIGDQIYADMISRHLPIGMADTHEEFQDRYIDAFGARNLRKLMQNIPTYMILDDHEIEDNWSQDRLSKSREKRKLFHLAITSYMNYQDSHNPQNYYGKLFYNFTCHNYPFFVLDVRTQKYRNIDISNGLDNHMLGRPTIDLDHPNQLDIFLEWLYQQQQENGNVPKFVVTPCVFVPSPIHERTEIQSQQTFDEGDSWPAFPVTKRKILQFIIDHDIKNVIFLSGDIHNVNIAKMYFSSTDEHTQQKINNLSIHSITSSAFYWPWPFADGNPSDFVHDSSLPGQKDTFYVNNNIKMDYQAWNFCQKNHFTRVTLDRQKSKIIVKNFEDDGNLINFRKTSELNLERW